MSNRVTVYLDENTIEILDKYNNKSSTVKKALAMYLNNREVYNLQKIEIEDNIKYYKDKIKQERSKLRHVRKQIKRIEELDDTRPPLYEQSVKVLKAIGDVTKDNLAYQAERLNVDVNTLKRWLYQDGYYEELFFNRYNDMENEVIY